MTTHSGTHVHVDPEAFVSAEETVYTVETSPTHESYATVKLVLGGGVEIVAFVKNPDQLGKLANGFARARRDLARAQETERLAYHPE